MVTAPFTFTCNPSTGPTTVGVAYTTTCTATGGTPPLDSYAEVLALPAGLKVQPTTANMVTISGIPTQAGDYSFRVFASDSGSPPQSRTVTFTGTISPAGTLVRSGSLSHLAAGGGWTTVITIVNTSTSPVALTVVLHADDGTALSLPLTTTQQGITQTLTTSSVNASLSPNATLLISSGEKLDSTLVGWAEILSSGPLAGFAIFRQTPAGGSPSEGTVPLETRFPSAISLPYDNVSGFVMGVALANLSASSPTITAIAWDESGVLLGSKAITVPGNGHTAFALPVDLPFTAGKRGIVRFQSSGTGGITGLGLRFSPFGTFTSVPTTPSQ